MSQEVSLLDALFIIEASDDNAKVDFGDQWADLVMHIYNKGIEEVLPEVPVEDHAKFTRAFFNLRGMVNVEMGLDQDPSS